MLQRLLSKNNTVIIPVRPCCICLENTTEYVECSVCIEGCLCRECALQYDIDICPVCRQVNTKIRQFKGAGAICVESIISAVKIVCFLTVYISIIILVGAAVAAIFDINVSDTFNYLLIGLLIIGGICFIGVIVSLILRVIRFCRRGERIECTDETTIINSTVINPAHSSRLEIRLI